MLGFYDLLRSIKSEEVHQLHKQFQRLISQFEAHQSEYLNCVRNGVVGASRNLLSCKLFIAAGECDSFRMSLRKKIADYSIQINETIDLYLTRRKNGGDREKSKVQRLVYLKSEYGKYLDYVERIYVQRLQSSSCACHDKYALVPAGNFGGMDD